MRALAFGTMMRGMHMPLSWQLDGFFSLVDASFSLASLAASISSSTRLDELHSYLALSSAISGE